MTEARLGPTTEISTEGEADSATELGLRFLWRLAVGGLVGMLGWLAWLVHVGGLYEAGSDFGYYLGLTGGILMLLLLLYPVRKRMGNYDRFGKMEHWFRFHMVAGIVGPLMVLFHSTFHTNSMNGAAALYAMLLVAVSGVVGRFIYRHIHRGLYGHHLTLAEVSQDLSLCSANMGSVYALQPDIEPRLKAFHDQAFAKAGSTPQRAWRFATLRWRSKRLARQVRHDAKQALRRHWRDSREMARSQLVLNYRLAREQIDGYLDAVVKASQLTTWERMFSLWHFVHIPFLYLLVFSGVVHVVAVHMY